jgi:hypothetical protein
MSAAPKSPNPDKKPDQPPKRGKGQFPANRAYFKKKNGIPTGIQDHPPRLGRPPLLNEELLEEFQHQMRACFYTETVADVLGLSRETLRDWCCKGREVAKRIREAHAQGKEYPLTEMESLHYRFSVSAKREKALAIRERLEKIKNDASWQSSAWIVERAEKELWGGAAAAVKEVERKMNEIVTMVAKIQKMNGV